jgi:MFS family permease
MTKISIRRRVLGLSSSGLLYAIGGGAFWFVFPILAEKAFNNMFVVGIIISFSSLVSLLFDIPMGRFSDRTGRKKLAFTGLIILAMLGLVVSSLRTLPEFLLFAFVLGFADLLILIPVRAYVMEISPEAKRSEYFGIFEAFVQLGFTIGPILAGILIADNFDQGITETGQVMTLFSLLAAITVMLLKETITVKEPVIKALKSIICTDKIYLEGISDFRTLQKAGFGILLTTFILVFIDGTIWAIEPLITKLGINPATAGIIMAMFIIPFILFEAPAGYLADRVGKKTLFFSGLIIAGLSLILFGLTINPNALITLAFIATTGLALTKPALDGLLSDLAAAKQRGSIVGVWDVAEDLGNIIAPLAGGFVAQTYGIGTAFISLGCLPLI